MGEPFASYSKALLRADDAAKRQHEAQVRGDHNAANRAALERLEALGDVEHLKNHLATTLLLMLRLAGELFPGRLNGLLGIDALTARVDELEDALLAAERQGVLHVA